jgi:hypothetical protein
MAIQTALASRILGDVSDAQTVAGTTQSDAATMLADHVQIASATAGQGVILKAGNTNDMRSVANCDSADSIFVYPPSGASFNGAAANAAVSLPARACALFIFVTSSKINVIV